MSNRNLHHLGSHFALIMNMLILNRRTAFLAAVDWNQVGDAWERGSLVAKTRPSARSKLGKVLIVFSSYKIHYGKLFFDLPCPSNRSEII